MRPLALTTIAAACLCFAACNKPSTPVPAKVAVKAATPQPIATRSAAVEATAEARPAPKRSSPDKPLVVNVWKVFENELAGDEYRGEYVRLTGAIHQIRKFEGVPTAIYHVMLDDDHEFYNVIEAAIAPGQEAAFAKTNNRQRANVVARVVGRVNDANRWKGYRVQLDDARLIEFPFGK